MGRARFVEKRCGLCKHFKASAADPGSGECRLYRPNDTGWPVVSAGPGNYCDEWDVNPVTINQQPIVSSADAV